MTTCIFDGKFSTDGDDIRNWVDAKMPVDGDDVRVWGRLVSWSTPPNHLASLTVDKGNFRAVGEALHLPYDEIIQQVVLP